MEEPKKNIKLKELAWDPWDERSNFTLSNLWNKCHEFFKYKFSFYSRIIYSMQNVWGPMGAGVCEFDILIYLSVRDTH